MLGWCKDEEGLRIFSTASEDLEARKGGADAIQVDDREAEGWLHFCALTTQVLRKGQVFEERGEEDGTPVRPLLGSKREVGRGNAPKTSEKGKASMSDGLPLNDRCPECSENKQQWTARGEEAAVKTNREGDSYRQKIMHKKRGRKQKVVGKANELL